MKFSMFLKLQILSIRVRCRLITVCRSGTEYGITNSEAQAAINYASKLANSSLSLWTVKLNKDWLTTRRPRLMPTDILLNVRASAYLLHNFISFYWAKSMGSWVINSFLLNNKKKTLEVNLKILVCFYVYLYVPIIIYLHNIRHGCLKKKISSKTLESFLRYVK